MTFCNHLTGMYDYIQPPHKEDIGYNIKEIPLYSMHPGDFVIIDSATTFKLYSGIYLGAFRHSLVRESDRNEDQWYYLHEQNKKTDRKIAAHRVSLYTSVGAVLYTGYGTIHIRVHSYKVVSRLNESIDYNKMYSIKRSKRYYDNRINDRMILPDLKSLTYYSDIGYYDDNIKPFYIKKLEQQKKEHDCKTKKISRENFNADKDGMK